MSTRRTIAALAVAAVAPFALSGCGTSFGAQTNQQYQAGVGANLRTGPVEVYNGLFVANPSGTATFSGGVLSRDETTITAVTVDGKQVRIQPIELAPNTLKTLGAGGEIVAPGIEPGAYVTIVMTTQDSDVTVEVPVVERTEEYAEVAQASGQGDQDEKNAQEQADDAAGATTAP